MYSVYQVISGDNIETIANKIGITPQELINLNGITEVKENDLIVVPKQNIFYTYTVKKGDNLYEISRKYNTNVNDLLRLNGLNKDDFIYPEQQLLIPRENMGIYITEENETINSIAKKIGISIEDIINQNENIFLLPDQLIMYTR